MTASPSLLRDWRHASDAQLARIQREAEASVAAFGAAIETSGSLLQSWIAGQPVQADAHYPEDELIDQRRGSQFYYHSHRTDGQEHGHLHLFWHATSGGRRRYQRANERRWARTAPSHLIAISLDARGLPVGLFTVNHWVTGGHWFDAATTLAQVERFHVGPIEGHVHSCRWLTGFVRMYEPLIAELLTRRDARIAQQPDRTAALENRDLEVLSAVDIDWSADLDALQAEVVKREAAPSTGSGTGHIDV